MSLLFDVVTQVTLPIVLLMVFGYAGQKRLRFDVVTLNRLVIYGALPCLFVDSLSRADLPLAEVRITVLFTVAQFFLLLALGWLAGRALGAPGELRAILALAAAFPNSGNFGIPLVQLAFGNDFVLHQAVITTLHVVMVLAVAPAMLSAGGGGLGALRTAFRTPLIPAVLLGLALNALDLRLPAVIGYPVALMGATTTPLSLTAIGAQLAAGVALTSRRLIGWGIGLRIVAAPVLTGLALLPLDLPEGLADLLLVGAATPAAILLAMFCREYDRSPELASAIVVASTVLSPIAITAAVLATRL